jgi:hypothetical protein
MGGLIWTALSGFEEALDRFGRFSDFRGTFGTTGGYGVGDTVVKVVFEESNGNALEGFGHRGNLGEHVDTVSLLFDHALKPAHLALDAFQSSEVVCLVWRISGRHCLLLKGTGYVQASHLKQMRCLVPP